MGAQLVGIGLACVAPIVLLIGAAVIVHCGPHDLQNLIANAVLVVAAAALTVVLWPLMLLAAAMVGGVWLAHRDHRAGRR